MARISFLILALAIAGRLFGAAAVEAQAAPPGKTPIVFAEEGLSESEKAQLESTARMVARWAMVQRVVGAVLAQNADPPLTGRIAEIEREWQGGTSVGGLAETLLSNDCAQALQAAIAANPGFDGAFVTDQQGALVCATQRPARYFQGEEEGWRRAFADGAGAIFVAAPADEPGSDLRVQPISVPVRVGGRTVGVLVVRRLADG
jgi:hypothetical protein